jgi:hypothetical protein
MVATEIYTQTTFGLMMFDGFGVKYAKFCVKTDHKKIYTFCFTVANYKHGGSMKHSRYNEQS